MEWFNHPQASKGDVRVIRVPVEMDLKGQNSDFVFKEDPDDPVLLLLDVLNVHERSPLGQLSDFLVRVDNLSHCLVWSRDVGSLDCGVDLIEFPRHRLSFKGRNQDGFLRLESVEHNGYHVSNFRTPVIETLLERLTCGILLENRHRELSLILPSSLPIRPKIQAEPLSCDIMFARSDEEWNVGCESGHYVYQIHLSHHFITTPTLASALYLLLLRLQTRKYRDVLKLADSCITDGNVTDEERNIFEQLQYIAEDQVPDAHACRLKLSLMFANTPLECSWEVEA